MNIPSFLEEHHCSFTVVPHHVTYSAERLAHELHVPGREVAKTVMLQTDGNREFVVAVLPANKKVDMDRVSQLLGRKTVKLADEDQIATQCPDCELGVLPPFGSQYGMKTITDASLADDKEIVFEGNTHREAIQMKFDEFRRIEHPIIGHIGKFC
jgi:Ala-tRNA(Pro) deacylase